MVSGQRILNVCDHCREIVIESSIQKLAGTPDTQMVNSVGILGDDIFITKSVGDIVVVDNRQPQKKTERKKRSKNRFF